MATPDGSEDARDVLAGGRDHPPWLERLRPQRIGVGIILVSVAIGLLLGYVLGHDDGNTGVTKHQATARSTLAPTHGLFPSPVVSPGITETGQRCAEQQGTRLQLGVEIVNESTTTVTLGELGAQLPLRGLRAVARADQTCGQLAPEPGAFANTSVPPGGTAWLRMTFDVLVKCPAALPVEFTIRYRQAGQSGNTELFAFPDLGSVPYSGCHSSSP